MKKLLNILKKTGIFFLATILATVLLYLVFAMFFDTDVERKLVRENKMYSLTLPLIQAEEQRRAAAVVYLQRRDSAIYNQVFHYGAPDPALIVGTPYKIDIDTVTYDGITKDIAATRRAVVASADRIDSLMTDICEFLAQTPSSALPPMVLPARGVTYSQVGAGFGDRMNPFLRASVKHNGLDLVLERGDTLYADASAVVVLPKGLSKGLGLVLELNHGNGYVTRMEHLESVLVSAGQKVCAGDPVATVGMTGTSFAPHLHYDIRRGGKYVDPVDYLFASVSPEEYVNILYMSSKTIQSLD